MPIYEYECEKCEETVELIASQKSTRPRICKRCGANMPLKVSGSARTPDKWK